MIVADVFDYREGYEPVTIRLPFSQRGYRIFNADGERVGKSGICLDALSVRRLEKHYRLKKYNKFRFHRLLVLGKGADFDYGVIGIIREI